MGWVGLGWAELAGAGFRPQRRLEVATVRELGYHLKRIAQRETPDEYSVSDAGAG